MTATTKTPLGPSTLVTQVVPRHRLERRCRRLRRGCRSGHHELRASTPTTRTSKTTPTTTRAVTGRRRRPRPRGRTGTVARKVLTSDATAYDPGQEKLRLKSIGQLGPANSVYVRIYEMTPSGPRVEAYTGYARCRGSRRAAPTPRSTVQVTLTGQGALAIISHPDTGAAVPTISGAGGGRDPADGPPLAAPRCGSPATGSPARPRSRSSARRRRASSSPPTA
jgi:hypothetical protein